MREHDLQSIPGSADCKCRCPETGQRVVMLLEIRVHASWVVGTTPRTCGELGQYGGLVSAISVLNPGMSTSHLFLLKLLTRCPTGTSVPICLKQMSFSPQPALAPRVPRIEETEP